MRPQLSSAFAIEHVGSVILPVMPSLTDIRRNTCVRIDPMIEDRRDRDVSLPRQAPR
jgi:hypothetical protein